MQSKTKNSFEMLNRLVEITAELADHSKALDLCNDYEKLGIVEQVKRLGKELDELETVVKSGTY